MKTNQKQNVPAKSRTKRKSETLEERVHQHLTDINSKITDDDIRNVKTELDIRRETAPGNEEANNEENKPQSKKSRKQKKENETDSKHGTPWNLLSEGYD